MKITLKGLLITSILILIVLPGFLFGDARPGDNRAKPLYAPDRIKIKLAPDAIQRSALPTGFNAEASSFGINELDQIYSRNGGERIIRAHIRARDVAWEARTGFDRWFVIRLDGRSTVAEAIRSFKSNRYIEDAIPEYFAYTTAVPNDTYYPNNWGHNNTAQLPYNHTGTGVGTIGFDSDAQLAWDQSQGYGSASVIIAIIDSGVDTAHPDLRLVAGYDYGDNDSNPMDDSAEPGHGTACSGIAAGKANNALGVTGVAGGCSVMPLKIASSDGSMTFTAIENALTHTGNNNVDVASMSFGAEGGMAEGDSPSTDTALEYAYSHGVTLLAATANSNAATMAYPSNHNKVISVGASSPTGQRKNTTSSDGENWWGSNYGVNTQNDKNSVDIMAPTILPATDITGSGGYDAGNYSMWFNGTSCATPYAAGVAALLISKDPSLTPAQVRTALISTATDMTFDGGAGWDRYTGYGLVNANAALLSLVPGMPACTITAPLNGAVINLNSTITVNVTATDTDGTITSVAFYVDEVLKNTDNASPWTWNWNSTGYTGGSHTIKAIATDNSSNTATSTVNITLLAPADEGFESGGFMAYPWINTSTFPWTVQSSEKYSGTYAAKSGAIGNSSQTELSLAAYVTSAGTISFFQNVSSESSYDWLRFYIDGVLQGEWSGAGSWTQQSYAVSSGNHTFMWRYSKDSSSLGGSDCAWIDHINFPPLGVYYAPPQNLSSTIGNGFVDLAWQAPGSGSPTSYKIFRNNSLLTTIPGLTYHDTSVANEQSYSYHVIAVYSGGESDPSNTVTATPTAAIFIEGIIGTGTDSTGITAACPINVYYQSLHGQSVYTKAELNAAGIYGPVNITKIGFNITNLSSKVMPNYVLRMGHTNESNVASWISTGLAVYWTSASYQPTATGWNMFTLSTPFAWNGSSNIVVDTAFGVIGSYAQTGTTQYTSQTNGYRYARDDNADQTNVFTGGSTSANRPNLKLIYPQALPDPEPVTFVESFESGIGDWLTANQSNAWACGTASKKTGTHGIYISNDSGTTNAYTNTTASISHLYRDISFPAGTDDFVLRFNWQGMGQLNTDYMRVYLVDTSTTPIAGTALASGKIGEDYYHQQNAWQEATITLAAGLNGLTKRLIFTWINNANSGTNPPAALDDIRIVPGSHSDAAVVIGNTVSISPPSVSDPSSNVIHSSLVISNLSGTPGFVMVTSGYNSQSAPYNDAGLDFLLSGAIFGGSTINFTHDLGFIPYQLAYKLGDSGNWNVVDRDSNWSTAAISWLVPASKAETDLRISFSNSEEGTLPVELSSFNAILSTDNQVRLNWVTATETGLLGYNIYRHTQESLDSAELISELISGTNTSTEQHYIFDDHETDSATSYYYWLQGLDLDGWSAFYGPVNIKTSEGSDTNPPLVPVVTELRGNYPNPFNPSTTLRYSLLSPAKVKIDIYNCRGQLVRAFSKEHASAGFYSQVFDGKDSTGNALASGVYIYRMRSGDYDSTRRMLLSK